MTHVPTVLLLFLVGATAGRCETAKNAFPPCLVAGGVGGDFATTLKAVTTNNNDGEARKSPPRIGGYHPIKSNKQHLSILVSSSSGQGQWRRRWFDNHEQAAFLASGQCFRRPGFAASAISLRGGGGGIIDSSTKTTNLLQRIATGLSAPSQTLCWMMLLLCILTETCSTALLKHAGNTSSRSAFLLAVSFYLAR